MRYLFYLFTISLIPFIHSSCLSEPDPPAPDISEETNEPSTTFYAFQIFEGHIFDLDSAGPSYQMLVGNDVKGTWKQDYGLAWMSTDTFQPIGPYGTVTIRMNTSSGFIESAVVSMTDVWKGTAQELNARNYSYASGFEHKLNILYNTENAVRAKVLIPMTRTSPNQSPEPMEITLVGEFAVVDK